MTRVVRLTGAVAVILAAGIACAPQVLAQTRPMERMPVNGGEIEYEVRGQGEPVLLIHGTGVAATFYPTLTELSLAGYRLIRFHRRGFAGSSRAPVPFSIQDQAADAVALLKGLGVSRAHVVGHSFGGMVALQMALDAPTMVHSLVIAEPPLFNPDAPASPFAKLEAAYAAGDKLGAMNTFSTMSYGADWRTLASRVPGGPRQVEADVDTVFRSEAPSMVRWRFTEKDAAKITQPIVYVTGGGRHGGSLKQFQAWMPKLESVVVPGVTHAMLMEDPGAVAEALAAFLKRHPF